MQSRFTVASWSICDTTKDEAPAAYKPMGSILKQTGPAVGVECRIQTEYNYKEH